MRVDIDKLEALEKAATPRPWEWFQEPGNWSPLIVSGALALFTAQDEHPEDPDNRFVIEVRNAFPELLAEVRELRGIAEAARELADEGCSDCGYIPPRLWTALAEYDAGGAK